MENKLFHYEPGVVTGGLQTQIRLVTARQTNAQLIQRKLICSLETHLIGIRVSRQDRRTFPEDVLLELLIGQPPLPLPAYFSIHQLARSQ